MKINESYLITMLLSMSAGCLSGMAIWGKAPFGGDELAAFRFALLALFLIGGHLFYKFVLQKHFATK